MKYITIAFKAFITITLLGFGIHLINDSELLDNKFFIGNALCIVALVLYGETYAQLKELIKDKLDKH